MSVKQNSTSAKPGFRVGQRVRILGVGARLLNRGLVVDEERKAWVVRPEGRPRARFSKRDLSMIATGRLIRQPFPRLAH